MPRSLLLALIAALLAQTAAFLALVAVLVMR